MLLFYFFTICQGIVDIDLKQKWNYQDTVTANNTYRIQQTTQQYYYVIITLQQIDPDFYMIVTYQQPYDPYINKANSYIDWVSQIENRSQRFLKLQPQGDSIYITTTGKIQFNYTIQVIISLDFICPNNCSYNGICKSTGCECNTLYVGNDCHQNAEQLQLDKINKFDFEQNETKYFYITVEDQRALGYSYYLYVESDNWDYSSSIFVILTEALYYSEFTHTYDNIFYTYAEFSYNFPNNISIIQTSDDLKPIVLVAVSYAIESTLSISINFDPSISKISSTSIIIIVVFTVLGSFIIIITIFCILRRIKIQRLNNAQMQHAVAQANLDHVKASPPVIIKQEADLVDEGLIPGQIQMSLENCSICLEGIQINNSHKTICKHKFHKNCITLWLQKHPDCPICRTSLKDELKLLEPHRA